MRKPKVTLTQISFIYACFLLIVFAFAGLAEAQAFKVLPSKEIDRTAMSVTPQPGAWVIMCKAPGDVHALLSNQGAHGDECEKVVFDGKTTISVWPLHWTVLQSQKVIFTEQGPIALPVESFIAIVEMRFDHLDQPLYAGANEGNLEYLRSIDELEGV